VPKHVNSYQSAYYVIFVIAMCFENEAHLSDNEHKTKLYLEIKKMKAQFCAFIG